MAQSDARFGFKANLSRENHVLSQPFGFSTCPGMLNPIFADFASPGDSYYINHDLGFLRTAPLAAPAMIDVFVHYETFFVPMQMLYQAFDNTVFAIKQQFSANFNLNNFIGNSFPVWDYYKYISRVVNAYPLSSERSLAFRLADMLDLNAINFCNTVTTLGANGYLSTENYLDYKYHPNFFPWQILAYNTIFHHYFRLDDKTEFDNVICNWDTFYSNSSPVQSLYPSSKFMTIWQRPWDFDYFTSSYRSPIVSDVNSQFLLGQAPYTDLMSRNTQPVGANGASSLQNSDTRGYSTEYQQNPNASAGIQLVGSTALIRQAFANEKLAMITGRTRKNYDSQVLAHYGVKVPHDVKHEITLIGRDTYKLHVGEVTSLASTEDSALGDLAGKGYATGKGHDIKFTCPCHGVIMTIFSIEPRKRYFSGFNRVNAVSNAFDFPVPEFDRLGNQPMYQYELGSAQAVASQTMSDIAGWKERYYQWKRRKARVSLAFMGRGVQSGGGVIAANNDWEPYFISGWAFGKHFASTNSAPSDQSRYYIDVECLDGLMLVPARLSWGDGGTTQSPDENWNDNPQLVYSHDPFIVDSDLKVKKVSWMSKDGEPVYPY